MYAYCSSGLDTNRHFNIVSYASLGARYLVGDRGTSCCNVSVYGFRDDVFDRHGDSPMVYA